MPEPIIGSLTEEEWRQILTGEAEGLRRRRNLYKLIPSAPRCKLCNAPFKGVGGLLMRLEGRAPFQKNPNFCERCLVGNAVGGVEIEISMLFADVRGSTSLAERIGPTQFSQLMNRFYTTATDILIHFDAFLDKLVGDEVIGLFIPGFAGPEHARRAVDSARDLLVATGHGASGGPWIPVGVGVHTGIAHVGLVGVDGGVTDLTALGDSMNTAARLASSAKAGEALISEVTMAASGVELGDVEQRHLALKGKSEIVDVRVMRVGRGE